MMRSGAFAFLGLFDTPFVCAVGLEAGLAGDDRADRRAVMCPSLRRCSTLAHAVRQRVRRWRSQCGLGERLYAKTEPAHTLERATEREDLAKQGLPYAGRAYYYYLTYCLKNFSLTLSLS
jgi:hypothetical protein